MVVTIHTYQNNPRAFKALIAARYTGANVQVEPGFQLGASNKTPAFLSKFPFGKVPTMDTPDGPLYESNAMAYYVAAAQQNSPLLGATAYERALVQQYLHVADGEVSPAVSTLVYPIICPGRAPTDRNILEKASQDVCNVLRILNDVLLDKTYLVGESITLADIAMACTLYWPFLLVLDPETRAPFSNVVRWFTTCVNQPQFKAEMGQVSLCETVATPESFQAMHSKKSGCCAKKTACCQQQKACADKPKVCCGGNKAEAPAPAHEEAEEEEPTFEDPKPKNPLDLLPTGKFSMDTWKRFYSNNETPESTKYFWDNFDSECYSMHHFLYKYNDELTKVFMSSNLIGGFYQRLDDLRKYLFGNMAVFGEDNSNMIAGAFIVRGGDIKACMADVPDIDSYHITAMDINDPEHRRMWEMFLAWEGDVNGKKLNVAKTFK